jgi:acyl-CoA thioester hydrolase
MAPRTPNGVGRKHIHVSRLAVRWRDMDINRHVNNTIYFRYFEQTRIEWCDTIRPARGTSLEFVIASAQCNYLRPITYPATVEVDLFTGPPGRTSFTFYYDLYDADDRRIKYAEGETRQVWVDRETGRSVALPEFIRALLA